jgi:hypothetical protein
VVVGFFAHLDICTKNDKLKKKKKTGDHGHHKGIYLFINFFFRIYKSIFFFLRNLKGIFVFLRDNKNNGLQIYDNLEVRVLFSQS